MARKGLLYYLFSSNKLPLYQDDATGQILEGNENYLKPNGQPAHLESSPDGWKGTLVKFARNIKYWGIFRDFTVPMKFVRDGAKILRNQMWLYGVECVCYIAIQKFDRLNLPYRYGSWYLGEINFPKYKEETQAVTVEAIEGGMTKFFKAYENTTYEIDVDNDPEVINVFMDGMTFDFNRTYQVGSGQEIVMLGVSSYFLGMFQSSNEGNSLDVLWQDMVFQAAGSPYPNDNWIVNNTLTARDIRIHGKVNLTYSKEVEAFVRAEIDDGTGSGILEINHYILVDESNPAGTTKDIAFDVTLTIPAGNRVHVKVLGGSPEDSETQFTVNGGEILFDYAYRYPATYVKALLPITLFDRIVSKMTGGQFGIKSDWLTTKNDIAITCGDALRGLHENLTDPNNPIKAPVIKTSIADFFKAFNIFSIRLGIEDNKLRIEPIETAFQDTVISDIGQVTGAFITVAEDIIFNSIKAGGEKVDYTDVNGKYEVNQGQEWTCHGTKVVRVLDLVSPYRRDPLGIELLRINFEQKTTTDSESDNDVFMLNIETNAQSINAGVGFLAPNLLFVSLSLPLIVGQRIRITGSSSNDNDYTIDGITSSFFFNILTVSGAAVTTEANTPVTIIPLTNGVYNLYRPAYSLVTGLPHWETSFNLELTPKKSILANGAFIHSILDLQETEKIKFSSADKNAELSTTLGGITVTEKEDIQIGSLPAQLFKPYYFNFTTQVPVSLLEIMSTNPYGKIQFTWNNRQWFGFLMDGGIKPATNDSQTWKLLCAPENDLSKFNP